MASTMLRQNYTASDVSALLPKFGDLDSDIRFMSLVDLCNILNAGPASLLSSDYTITARVIDCLLKSLDDTNGDVQSQALKCIGPLALKAPHEILCPFVEKLTNLETTKSMDRSIPATATRTMVAALPRSIAGVEPSKATKDAYSAVSKVLIPRLLGYLVIPHGIKGLPDPPPGMLEVHPGKGVDVDAIDLLHELIRCYGPMLQDAEKKALRKRLAEILDDGRTGNVAKKKVVVTMAVLANYFSDSLLSTFVADTVDSFQSSSLSLEQRRLLISLLGSIAHSIPGRLGPYLKTLAPFVLSPLSEQEYEELCGELDEGRTIEPAIEDIKEAALVTLEEFLAFCSNDMRPFTNQVLEGSLRYIMYDPAIAPDEDDEDMDGLQDTEVDEDSMFDLVDEEFEEDAALSDGDDSSWKIRRCAAKVLYTMISTRASGDLLDNGILYEKAAPVLIKCFKEREESVRLEVVSTLAALIKRTGEGYVAATTSSDDEGYASASQASKSRKRRRGRSDASMFDVSSSNRVTPPIEFPTPTSGPRADLARQGHSIILGVVKLLKQNSLPTKQAATTLLRDFVLVQHGGLMDQLGEIVEPVMDAISTPGMFVGVHGVVYTGGAAIATSNSLRIAALQLLQAICDTHSSRTITPYIDQIVPGLTAAVDEKYFKVSGEAISVAESVVKVITPPRSSGVDQQLTDYLERIFDVVVEKVRTNDTDLEVRRKAIHALGVIIARSSSSGTVKMLSGSKRTQALDVLQERLKNETTRITSVQAIDNVVISTTNRQELKPLWIQAVSLELARQLRKSDRNLRGNSLAALKHLTGNPVTLEALEEENINSLVELLLPIVNPGSLSLLGMAMNVLTDLTKQSPRQVVNSDLCKALCAVVVTPLNGHILDAFLGLVDAIGSSGLGQPLMQALLKDVGVTGDPAIVGSAIGTLLASGDTSVGVGIYDIVDELRNAPDDQRKCLALAILGEASLRLGQSSPLRPEDFLAHFSSKSDQVPRAAAVALGRAGAGNTSVYLPTILSKVDEPGKMQLQLLHSIKEVLQYSSKSRADISGYTGQIWQKLLKVSGTEDNNAIGAECVGRLISIEPSSYLPLLQDYLQDPAPSVRGMVIQAVRFALTDADDAFDEVLRPRLTGMLSTMLGDPALENRRLALITLNSAAQNKANLILPHLPQLLPFVFKESKLNPVLVREVMMGPFKHKVDDGLEIRKSAYETLHALMDTAFARMNSPNLFERVIAGLQDDHDIMMLCNLMLTKLISLDADETFRRLDSIAERYQAILSNKLKENAVKQEVEKAQEAKTDVLRVSIRLHSVAQAMPNATISQTWKSYWEWIGKDFKPQLQAAEALAKYQR